jgi:hypothetical protein
MLLGLKESRRQNIITSSGEFHQRSALANNQGDRRKARSYTLMTRIRGSGLTGRENGSPTCGGYDLSV